MNTAADSIPCAVGPAYAHPGEGSEGNAPPKGSHAPAQLTNRRPRCPILGQRGL
jgi:hypothetical protein